jgi:hypothetical protein
MCRGEGGKISKIARKRGFVMNTVRRAVILPATKIVIHPVNIRKSYSRIFYKNVILPVT